MSQEYLQQFLFEDTNVRGVWVRLAEGYRQMLEHSSYEAVVGQMLGEFLAASTMLSTTIKFEGLLSLQVRAGGPVRLLQVECTHQQKYRGIARTVATAGGKGFAELMQEGSMAITIEPSKGQRYQGIVPVEGGSLAASLASYFQQSEQLPTRFWLAANDEYAVGLLLQQLPSSNATPDAREKTAADWQHLIVLAETLEAAELLSCDCETILHRLYHQEQLTVFAPREVGFECSCSRQRTDRALHSLGRDEVESLLQEQGEITIDCEFCNARYFYTEEDVHALFQGPSSPQLQ